MNALTKAEIEREIQNLNNWKYEENHLVKQFEFLDFKEAFAFLTRVALLSEEMDHHADWSGVYNKVLLKWSTHSAGGVSSKDFRAAKTIDSWFM